MTLSMARYISGIKESRSADLLGLERAMYEAYLRYDKFHKEHMRPLWYKFVQPCFWGYGWPRTRTNITDTGIVLFNYDGEGLSQNYVAVR